MLQMHRRRYRERRAERQRERERERNGEWGRQSHRRGSCSISYNLWATLQIKREHKQSAFLGSARDECECEREGGRESHIYRFICHSPLALRPRHSCCVCWHFMWFAQQLQRDKTKQLPCSVLFARLLLRLLISVNREGSFVCPSSLGPSLPIHVKLVCGFVRSIDTACQMHLRVARTQKKRC